jgi:hypothetical protein
MRASLEHSMDRVRRKRGEATVDLIAADRPQRSAARSTGNPRLEKAIQLSSFRVLKEQEKRHGFIERAKLSKTVFREGRAGQWRTLLSREQVQRIVADHREQMEHFAYVPEGF